MVHRSPCDTRSSSTEWEVRDMASEQSARVREFGPEFDGGDGEGGGGGRAARLEELAEVDGQRGVVNLRRISNVLNIDSVF